MRDHVEFCYYVIIYSLEKFQQRSKQFGISLFIFFLATAAVTVIVPTLLGVSQRGFFCDDDSIRYEYRKDTITAVQLMLYNLVLNAATVSFLNVNLILRPFDFRYCSSNIIECKR